VSFTISVVPKSIRDDTKVDFCISSYEGNEQITVTGTRKGMAFAAEGTLPTGNYYITALLTENGTQKAENLGSISVSPLGLAALYSFDWYTSPDYIVSTDESGRKCHPCGLLVLECMEGTLPPRRADNVELVMYKNGEEVTCLSLDTKSEDKWQDSFTLPKGYGVKASSEVEEAEADYIIEPDRMFYVSEFDFGELDAQIGDEFRIELVVRDTLGLTYRESELDSFKFISETSVTGSSTTHGYLELDSDLID
jgi:hypothetical protein